MKLIAASVLALSTAVQVPAALAQDGKAERVVPPSGSERQTTLAPELAEEKPEGRITFQSDPIADGCVIVVSLGSAGVLELINSTGEIRPQQVAPDFDRSQLISIDRDAVSDTLNPGSGPRSNVGLGIAAAYALVDPLLSGWRENNVQTGLVDAIMYSETVALTLALTNVVKIAVRRPRPIAYIEAEARDDPNYTSSSTDSSLSFFSGHASMTAAIGATATYLAFARSTGKLRPWLTLALATGLTTFVSVERVRAGKHFPTDVLAGAFAGAGIGVVVPHLHRTEDVLQRRVWVGFSPAQERERTRGGTLTLSGQF